MRRVLALAILAILLPGLAGCQVGSQKNEKNPSKTENQKGGQSGRGVVVVNLDGSDPNSKPDHTVTVPKVVLNKTEKRAEDTDSKTEKPPGMTDAQVKANDLAQQVLAAKDLLPLQLPFAAPSQPGCRTDFVRNYSSRRGVAPHMIVLHWTGSSNIRGWADVLGIVGWFNQSRSQASSNYVVDAEGHCAYAVPEQEKAWTQAAGNPFAVSFEIVHPGGPNEKFCPGACRVRVAKVMAAISKRWHIPLRRGSWRNCTPGVYGVTAHRDLGVCGGGHPDIGNFSTAPFISLARHYLSSTHGYRPTAADRTTCRKLNWWRRHGRPKGKAEKNAIRRRQALAKRGVVCTKRGPLKTRR